MFDLSTTAERLRIVKQAHHDFLTLWAVDQALDCPDVTDRICRDLRDVGDDPFGRFIRLHSDRPNADN
jgi:hypothetical protein